VPVQPDGADAGQVDEVRVELVADAQAPGHARRATREALRTWQLPALVDRVLLVVSELVTNSVRYGSPPLRLVLSRFERSVRVDVHDAVASVPDLPGRCPADDDAESGRGLLLVSAVADDVGVEHVPGDGKHVYASFTTP
jgi:anti-sigma regulatory factor (Ser/Thr protein kinase)